MHFIQFGSTTFVDTSRGTYQIRISKIPITIQTPKYVHKLLKAHRHKSIE
jgi:hypothetical protein